MIKLLKIAALLFPFQNEMSAKNLLTIPSIFSDNMVLQQNTKVLSGDIQIQMPR